MDTKIIEKYDKAGPRYTSYPPANLFRKGVKGESFIRQIRESNSTGTRGISLYVHVPFCPRLCHFCGCNTQLGTDPEFIERYFRAMLHEIDLVAKELDKERPVTQIHWGGGTPNSVDLALIEEVMKRFRQHFNLHPEAEITMECSPAYLRKEHLIQLAGMGFNRISLGVQDFNDEVLRIINRKASVLPPGELVDQIHSLGASVNLDFVYGLPGQRVESYLATLQQAVDLRPDRLVTFSYAHVPWVKQQQKILEKTGIPGPRVKMEMLLRGFDLITASGYEAIGMDHFALPGDEMARAFREHSLHRNFQGYCTRKHTGQVYAFGASSISQLHRAYFQNIKEADAYVERMENNEWAVEKGYILNDKEVIIRSVINQVMCNGILDLKEMADKLDLNLYELKEILQYPEEELQELAGDGLLELGKESLRATREGMLLIRVIARTLDPNFEHYHKAFSKTI